MAMLIVLLIGWTILMDHTFFPPCEPTDEEIYEGMLELALTGDFNAVCDWNTKTCAFDPCAVPE